MIKSPVTPFVLFYHRLELLKESKGDLSKAFSEIMMNVNLTDDYQVLGLNRDCTLQVKAAYEAFDFIQTKIVESHFVPTCSNV